MDIKVNVLNKGIVLDNGIVEACDGDFLLAKIFYNRGYKDPDTITQMLKEEYYIPTKTSEFPCIEKAVARMVRAIENKERICVYGDYDVDGVTSTVVLVECLRLFTENVEYHVPDRFTEGYGMNEEVIKNLGSRDVSLIITCDCGISNINEISMAKSLGMDVILTDHHNVPQNIPEADVILNPKILCEGHRARNISGCAMAYFLCLALLEEKNMALRGEDFLDLLALSLIADVVSLNGENRYLLKKGIPKIFNTDRVGLKCLIELAGQHGNLCSEEDIAFQIAPRINAAGRMETARLPVELFLSKNHQKAREMSSIIDYLNSERKRVQQNIIDQAIQMVENVKKNKTILVLYSEYWHHGIIGIAAGRICELYKKPAILLSLKEDGATVVGSARSIEEINVYELIKECSGRLLKFGGHSQAAGLSLLKENLDCFTKEIEIMAEKKHFIKDTINVNVDDELSLIDIDEDLYERLKLAGPYGEGFEAPKFYTRGVVVLSDRKTEKNHHIMVIENKNTRIQAVKWFGEKESLEGQVYNIVYKVSRNTYRDTSKIQLTIEHMFLSEGAKDNYFNCKIIDGRNKDIATLYREYEDVQVFYEGVDNMCTFRETSTVNRHTIKESNNLIFLSPPPNTEIFREVIAIANPQNVIINFSCCPQYSLKNFILNLLGILKHIINNDSGRGYTDEISLKLGVEDGILKSGLKYLRAKGMISYFLSQKETKLFVTKGSGEENNIGRLEANLKNALMEKYAYQKFILGLDVNKFIEYLK